MTRRKSFFIKTFVLLLAGVPLWESSASGAGKPAMIRDTEIENTIRAYAAPLLKVAGLNDDAFNVHIVRDNALNAFVARGQRLFVTTGLLRRSENAGQLMGVIAHEIGHISGGHLARLHGAMERAGTAQIVSTIISVAAGVLAGDGTATAAVSAGGRQIAERSFLNFSRAQEESADQAGIRYLDAAGLSSKGLLDFLNILSGQELLHSSRQDEYVRTHPLTVNRVRFVRHHVEISGPSLQDPPERFEKMHRRMVAKLDGFLDPPGTTLQRYSAEDKSVAARYARSVALFELANLEEGLPLIDGLIAEYPDDPYFHELKGQLLFENGRLAPALAAYREAVRLLPDAPLLRISIAHVELEMGQEDLVDDALVHLKESLRNDRFIPLGWRLAGTAYARKGDMGHASWALAEYNLLIGRKQQAAAMADRAIRILKQGDPAWLRAHDIKQQTDQKS